MRVGQQSVEDDGSIIKISKPKAFLNVIGLENFFTKGDLAIKLSHNKSADDVD